jgi:hypothetical protein
MLINTDGLTIVGAGSEWFWAMGQFVIITATLVGVYRQVRVQAGATEIQLSRELLRTMGTAAQTRSRLEVLKASKAGTNRAELPYGPAATVGDLYEEMAGWVRSGHMPLSLVYRDLKPFVRIWWFVLEPFVRSQRIKMDRVDVWDNWEWLVAMMDKLDRKAGVIPTQLDEATFAKSLDDRIERALVEARDAEGARDVPLASGPVAGPRVRQLRRPRRRMS